MSTVTDISCPTVRVHPEAVAPYRATPGSVGHDIFCVAGLIGLAEGGWSPVQKNEWVRMEEEGYIEVYPHQTVRLRTGFKQAIPEGYAGRLDDRSSLGCNKSMKILGGIIDSDFRGEWMVTLVNLSTIVVRINVGDKITQCIYYPKIIADCPIVPELDETERGAGGFGSTDKKV